LKVEIIKEECRQYKAGDILSIGNPFGIFAFMLYENLTSKTKGAVDLGNGSIYKEIPYESNFLTLVNEIVSVQECSEWKVFDSNSEVKLILGK